MGMHGKLWLDQWVSVHAHFFSKSDQVTCATWEGIHKNQVFLIFLFTWYRAPFAVDSGGRQGLYPTRTRYTTNTFNWKVPMLLQ
eukprot:2701815-Rhodomonas_salina.1